MFNPFEKGQSICSEGATSRDEDFSLNPGEVQKTPVSEPGKQASEVKEPPKQRQRDKRRREAGSGFVKFYG